jgi:hypothetical protein
MGSTDIYLMSERSAEMSPVQYAERAVELLTRTNVICVADYEEKGWFGLGDESLLPFEHQPEDEYGFDLCVVYGRPELALVPLEEEVEPRCPACDTDVGAAHNQIVCQIADEELETGVGDVRITCPGCGQSWRLDQLMDKLGNGLYLTDRYVNFNDVIGRLRPQWLAEFDRAMGVRHVVRTYWST